MFRNFFAMSELYFMWKWYWNIKASDEWQLLRHKEDNEDSAILTIVINIFSFFRALKDAERAITLAKDWPKGYFRKGRALSGLRVSIIIVHWV